MITDPWFYLLAIPALLLTSISKGGFGAGLGVLAVPLMALRLPVSQVIAIILPIICLMDIASVWIYRGQWDTTILRVTLPGALLGILLGSVSFGALPDVWLRLLVGVSAVGFPLQRWFVKSRRRAGDGHQKAAHGALWATVSGFSSFLANAGGPPFAIYMLALRLDKTVLVGTTAVFFAVVNLSKLLPFAVLGLFTRTSLLTALILSPIALVGIGLGLVLHRHLNAQVFYRVSYALVFMLGAKFVYTSVVTIL
jgi:uncharacterized membrane protein YfcA